MTRKGKQASASFVAFPAVLAALSLLMLYGASLAPTGLWGLTAAAGLCPMAVVASLGVRSGFVCWGGSSLLAILLIPNKFCAMLYAVLFGVYPIVKALAERTKSKWKNIIIKVSFFNAAISLLFFTMGTLMTTTLPQVFAGKLWLIYVAGNVVFWIYDFGLTRLIFFYLARIDRVARRGRR